MEVVWKDGVVIPATGFSIGTDNRSFRFGDGLFETIRVVHGKAVFFNQHYIRFIEGLADLKMEIPKEWSVLFLKKAVEDLARENGHLHARIRMTAWRSGAGNYAPETHVPELLIESYLLPEPYFTMNTTGKGMSLFTDRIKWAGNGSFYKSANAGTYTMASHFAAEEGAEDAFITNQHGRVIEAIHSNVFAWNGQEWLTPTVTEGCVDGVVRRVLLKQFPKWGIPVVQQPLDAEVLYNAEEVMLTNTIKGVEWVGSFGKASYSNKLASMVLGKLNELLPLS